MAFDRDALMERLKTNYFSRQEILYKLPLNIPIDSIWPDLLNMRKMNGIILPLHRSDGHPFWYTLTDKMIAASEEICTAALEFEEKDSFHPGMTTAMTEEMYFTSLIEGAQIDLQTAMDFLESGKEPQDILEQMIQNNRAAWTDMVKALFYPLDERFIRATVYRLTDGMNDQAVDYRQNDIHPIPAMESELYTVPSADMIPGMMNEFYNFLSDSDTHPLIKAAIGQAYILVVRPFPEGNERLSRMLSYAILLRCGYNFYRDISLSGVIAGENYRYYKAMREIIREENGGDLTYFVEYYLDLLARALKKGRNTEKPEITEKPENEEYLQLIDDKTGLKFNDIPNARERKDRIRGALKKLLHEGVHEFTEKFWKEYTKATNWKVESDFKYMTENGLLKSKTVKGSKIFYMPLKEQELTTTEMGKKLQDLKQHGVDEQQMAEKFETLLQEKRYDFSCQDWMNRFPQISKVENKNTLALAVSRGIVSFDGLIYSFCFEHQKSLSPEIAILPESSKNMLFELMKYFQGTEFSVADAAEKTGLSLVSVSRRLVVLFKRGILKRREDAVTMYWLSEEVYAIFRKDEDGAFRQIGQEQEALGEVG